MIEEAELKKVLILLQKEYGWDFLNALTTKGEQLVKDTIEAYKQCRK